MENQGQKAGTNNTQVRRERVPGPITVDHVMSSQFDKPGTQQAQIRQQITVKSYYPTAQIVNSKSDNLFARSEFSTLSEREFTNVENRVTWMIVPEGTTAADVESRLKQHPKAIIYREISNRPILTDNQMLALNAGLQTMDDYANRQVLRFAEGTTDDETGEDLSGQLILDPNGKVQYRVNFFSMDGKADVDHRNKDKADFYASPEIMEEIGAGNLLNQTM